MSKIKDQDAELHEKLKELSCPFTWNMDDALTSYYALNKTDSSDKDDNSEDFEVPVESFIHCLMSCYEEIRKDNMEVATKILENAKNIVDHIIRLQELDGTINTFEHVFYATKCHMLYKKGNTKGAQHILQSIGNKANMTRKEVGALYGCQCVAWSLYFDFGKDKAVAFAERAIRSNPENPLWYFILAKNLRRHRRVTSIHSQPLQTERYNFQKAYELSKNPLYGVYCAQMYRECNNSERNQKQKKMNEKRIFNMYKNIMMSNDLNVSVLLRLTLGLIRLNSCNTQVFVNKCLSEIERKDPSNITFLHYKALYLKRFEPTNKSEFLKYLKAASEGNNFPAEMLYVESANYDEVDSIKHLHQMQIKYDGCIKEKKQAILLGLATLYYLKTEIDNAAKYYLMGLKVDPKATKLKVFYKFKNFTTKSIYYFLKSEFLPKLSAKADDFSMKMYSDINELLRVE